MSEEATTSEPQVEGTEEVSTSGDETANTRSEGTKEVSEPDIPEDIKSEFDRLPPDKKDLYNKEFKRFLTKYTQKKAEEFKSKDTEIERIRKDYEETQNKFGQLAAQVKMALQDQQYYDKIRKEAGFVQEEPEQRPTIETAEDMINYIYKLEEKVDNLKKGIPEEASKISRAEIERIQLDQNYLSANNKLKSESNVFKKYEPIIISYMKSDPDLMKMWNGKNDYDVLKAATDKFYNSFVKEDVEKGKQEIIESYKKKKAVSTIAPQKSISSKTGIPLDRREQIIAKIRERFG